MFPALFFSAFFVSLFFVEGGVFRFFAKTGRCSDSVSWFFQQQEDIGFSVFQCSHFFGYFFASFPFQWVLAAASYASVIHRIDTSPPTDCPDYPSMRSPMLYIDLHTAGPKPSQININNPRLIQHQDGQEHSANGTGPEETCAKGGAASDGGAACRHIVLRHAPSERPYWHDSKCPACLPCAARALAGTAGSPCGHRRSTRPSGGLN
jgi:hypothetical protein